MPHLPNEIWLTIIAHCEARDIWNSLRPTNQQLRDCAEEYFAKEYLSNIVLILPIALPTYDIRNPIRGKAVFRPIERLEYSLERATYVLSTTEPDQYHSHFLGRWKGMSDSDGGWLREKMAWEMEFGTQVEGVRLRLPRSDGVKQDRVARVSFEWKPAMTSFFKERWAAF